MDVCVSFGSISLGKSMHGCVVFRQTHTVTFKPERKQDKICDEPVTFTKKKSWSEPICPACLIDFPRLSGKCTDQWSGSLDVTLHYEFEWSLLGNGHVSQSPRGRASWYDRATTQARKKMSPALEFITTEPQPQSHALRHASFFFCPERADFKAFIKPALILENHHIDRTQRKANTNAEEIPSTFPARCMMRSQSEM